MSVLILKIEVEGSLLLNDNSKAEICEYNWAKYDFSMNNDLTKEVKALIKKFKEVKTVTIDLLRGEENSSYRENIASYRAIARMYEGIEYCESKLINGRYNFDNKPGMNINEFLKRIKELQMNSIDEYVKLKLEVTNFKNI